MTDYTQNVSYGPKDALSTGDAAKRIKGTELDAEFAEISTAIASKEDEANKGANNGYCGLGAGGLVDPTDLPAATDSAQGAVELATTAEATTGTDTTRAVTAAGVKAAIDALKAAGLILTGASLEVQGTLVQLKLNETDADSDEKQWEWRASGGDLFLYTDTDGGSAVGTPIAITRNGTTVTGIALTATNITANGSEILTAATGAPIATSGSFMMELATDSSGGSVLASGTAYWKKYNGVVTMRTPDLYVTTTDTSLFLRNIPAACQPALTGSYVQGVVVAGVVNGLPDPVEIRINEGVAYWELVGLNSGGFTGGSTLKGIGTHVGGGCCFSYQVTD